MKLFSGKRTKHNTAFVVLMLWTFAMASGVANACLLEAYDTHSHGHMVEFTDAISAPDLRHEQIDTDHAPAYGSKVPCQKFCSEESKVITKQHFGLDQPNPGHAPLIIVLWTMAEPSGHTLVPVDAMQPLPLSLPLRVRYSRMAL